MVAGSTGTVGRLLVARVLLGRAASSDKRQLDVGVGVDKVGEAVLDVGETPFVVVEGKPSRGSSEVAAADDVLFVPFWDVGGGFLLEGTGQKEPCLALLPYSEKGFGRGSGNASSVAPSLPFSERRYLGAV